MKIKDITILLILLVLMVIIISIMYAPEDNGNTPIKEKLHADIYSMNLHECTIINSTHSGQIKIFKVPNGWVYIIQENMVFVPEK